MPNYSLFTKQIELGFIGVLVYVDIILGSKNKDLINQFNESLSSQFKLKNLGNLQYFLNLEISKSTQGMVVSQRKFILELLEEYGVLSAKPSSTPVELNSKLVHDDNTTLQDPSVYR